MKEGWQAVVVQTLQAQQALLHDGYRQQQQLLERLLASQDRQLALIEEQNALLRASERVHSQRREEAAIQSFGLDHENIELRQRSRQLEAVNPAFNEAENLGLVIRQIAELYPDFEIIVVNDGSTDESASAAKDSGAIVYSHPYNLGNGAAIKSGIRIASGDILVFMDGDGQHDPKDIEGMLSHLPEYDMVVGARGREHHASWSRALGNRIYNRFASYVAKYQVEDLTSGFRAIKAELAQPALSSSQYLFLSHHHYPRSPAKRKKRQVCGDSCRGPKEREEQHQAHEGWCPILHDHHKDMCSLFSLEDVPSCECVPDCGPP